MASPRPWLCTTVWLILVFGATIVNDKVINNQLPCTPVKTQFMFIMDSFRFEQSFTQLRRFIIKFVAGLPDGTPVFVVTVGTEIKHFEFLKIAYDESWNDDIGLETSTHVNITYETLRDAIDNFLDKNGNKQMSEMIIWLVNENTIIHEKVKDAMQNKNNLIVLYGKHTKGDVWTDLSGNEEHICELGNGEAVITSTVQLVNRQYCNDFFSSENKTRSIQESLSTNGQERDDIGRKLTWTLVILTILIVSLFSFAFMNIYFGRIFWKDLRRRNNSTGGVGLLDTHKLEEFQSALTEKMTRITKFLQDQFSLQKNDLTQQISDYERKLEEKDQTNQMKEYQTKVDEIRDLLGFMKKEMEKKDGIIKQLKDKLDEMEHEKKHLESELSVEKKEIVKGETEIKVRDELIEKIMSECKQAALDLSQAQNQVYKKDKQLKHVQSTMSKKVEELETEVSKKKLENSQLQDTILVERDRNEHLTAQVKTYEGRLVLAQTQDSTIEQLKNDLAKKNNEKECLERKLSDKEEEIKVRDEQREKNKFEHEQTVLGMLNTLREEFKELKTEVHKKNREKSHLTVLPVDTIKQESKTGSDLSADEDRRGLGYDKRDDSQPSDGMNLPSPDYNNTAVNLNNQEPPDSPLNNA